MTSQFNSSFWVYSLITTFVFVFLFSFRGGAAPFPAPSCGIFMLITPHHFTYAPRLTWAFIRRDFRCIPSSPLRNKKKQEKQTRTFLFLVDSSNPDPKSHTLSFAFLPNKNHKTNNLFLAHQPPPEWRLASLASLDRPVDVRCEGLGGAFIPTLFHQAQDWEWRRSQQTRGVEAFSRNETKGRSPEKATLGWGHSLRKRAP